MFSWFRSKLADENEYISLRKRVLNVELRLDEIEQFQENIRNMARKVQTRAKKEENEAKTDTESTDLKSQILVPE